MKNIFKTRYRIVIDKFAGFTAQFRYWWMPFYLQLGGVNTHITADRCEAYIRLYMNNPVRYIS
jgi:hypothetical protein